MIVCLPEEWKRSFGIDVDEGGPSQRVKGFQNDGQFELNGAARSEVENSLPLGLLDCAMLRSK